MGQGQYAASDIVQAPPQKGQYSTADIAAPKKYDAASRGAKMKGTPEPLPDTYMGTITKDFAGIPEGLFNAVRHPVNTAIGAFHQLMSLPGDVVEDISKGNWGKLAAKATELAIPALGSEKAVAAAGNLADAATGGIKGAAGAIADAATAPGTRDVVGMFSPRAGKALDLAAKIRKAAASGEAAPADAAAVTPGEALAKQSGADWSKLSPNDKQMLEQVAKARENVAAQPPPPRPAAQPEPAAAPSQPTAPVTVSDLIQQELAAKRAAQPVTPQPLQGGNPPPDASRYGVNAPLRPPMAQQTAPAPAQAPIAAPVTAPVEPAPMSTPQAEAAMVRKTPAPTETPGRSPYTASGDLKSPQMRAMERINGNTEAKAQRWASAVHEEGFTPEDVGNMTAMERQVVTDGLIAKGKLKAGETPPDTSFPLVKKFMKKMQADKIAQALKDEMVKSGTIQ